MHYVVISPCVYSCSGRLKHVAREGTGGQGGTVPDNHPVILSLLRPGPVTGHRSFVQFFPCLPPPPPLRLST